MNTNEPTILLVDHSAKARSLLGTLLTTRLGCGTILEATNGVEAWQTIQHRKLDAVVLNRRLPGMDGLELLLKIRGSKLFATLPVLMILNSNDDAALLKAMQLGVSDFLTKPFTPQDFAVKYRRLLQGEERRALPRQQVAAVRSAVSLTGEAFGTLTGTVVNISMSGILTQMQFNRALAVYDKCLLNIRFFLHHKGEASSTILSQLVRIEWNLNPRERDTAFYAFTFNVERPEQREFLEKVTQHLKATLPPVIK